MNKEFMSREVNYLGHVLNRDGLFTQESKRDIIMKYEKPKTIKQLQSFIG